MVVLMRFVILWHTICCISWQIRILCYCRETGVTPLEGAAHFRLFRVAPFLMFDDLGLTFVYRFEAVSHPHRGTAR